MNPPNLFESLRFYFITDEAAPDIPPYEQAHIAVAAGATTVQYRNKSFDLEQYEEVMAIRRLCKSRGVTFLVNDHVLLARAVEADGVHIGQADTPPQLARRVLGPDAIIGLTVSNLTELAQSDLNPCDYIGTGPVYPTATKADAKAVKGIEGLREMVRCCPVPVVAIGGITAENAAACLAAGAGGVAVISCISRAEDPQGAARALGSVMAMPSPEVLTSSR